MAARGFGIPGLKFANLDLGSVRPKLSALQPFHGSRAQEVIPFEGLVLSNRSQRRITACQCSGIGVDSSTATANLEGSSSVVVPSDQVDQPSPLIPNSFEVESLLSVLCDTTSIAEFKLKLGGFHLHVTRALSEEIAPSQPPSPEPVTSYSIVQTPDLNGSASSPSLALTKPAPSPTGVQTLLDKAADEGLKILQSPRVGYFRRSRTIKGKRAPPSCKEKDVVKEGQVLCYIEQLGGEIPVESDVSGEVVKILKEDGEAVGYGDALVAVLPSFPGIMNLK